MRRICDATRTSADVREVFPVRQINVSRHRNVTSAQQLVGHLAEGATRLFPPYGLLAKFALDAFFATFFPPPLPSSSSALRTCLNSSSDALSAFGNFRSSVSSALTIAEPITTRANHLWSAGTTYHGATVVEVCLTMS